MICSAMTGTALNTIAIQTPRAWLSWCQNAVVTAIAMLMLMQPSWNAHAAPPAIIHYQGSLATAAGAPVNGSVAMPFRLYAAASGGAAIYSESQPAVTVTNGSFNVQIGAITPLALPFDAPYWLTMAVNADNEMSPRQPLASSAYAFRAAATDKLARSRRSPCRSMRPTG